MLSVADLVSEVNGLGFSAKDLSSEAKSQSTSMIVISGTSCCGKPIGPGLPNCPFCLDSIVAALQEQQGALMVTMDAVAATMSMASAFGPGGPRDLEGRGFLPLSALELPTNKPPRWVGACCC